MIRPFADRDTEHVWRRELAKRFDPRIHKTANRKLHLLDAATTLGASSVPPGSHLEALKGDRAGQYSIRIDKQRRICFRWTDAGAEDAEITDYH